MSVINTRKLKMGLTGSTGFIGGAFLKEFANDYDIVTINLRDPDFLARMTGLDAFVHCAGLAHLNNPLPREEYFKVNFEFTKKLVDACIHHHTKQFIYISTLHVNLKNPTFYSESKLAAENYLKSMESQITVSIIRPPMVYGENCKGNFPILAKVIQLSPWLPFNYTNNRRSIIYILNLTGFISHLLRLNISGTFTPQDAKTVSTYELACYILKGFGQKKPVFKPTRLFLFLLKKTFPIVYDRLYSDLFLEPEINVENTGYHPPFSTALAIEKTVQSFK